LSPANRADPCASPNIALGKSVTASGNSAESPASAAVDGTIWTLWNSGGPPRGWIEVDLGAEHDLTFLRLGVPQTPAGRAVHKVWGKSAVPGAPYVELQEIDRSTADGEIVEVAPGMPWVGIRYLHIETIWGPSWPAWREIEVFSAP